MRDDPDLDRAALAQALRAAYGLNASSFTFIPGLDLETAAYAVETHDGRRFLKVRFGAFEDPPLEVPRALLDAGVPNILAPVATLAGTLSHADDGRTLVLYPFAEGENAMLAGMTPDQWRSFGATLRAVHDSGLEQRFADRLPADAFGLPSASELRTWLAAPPSVDSPEAHRLRAFLDDRGAQIGRMLARAEALGARLRHRSLPRVLCHGDIHAANILVDGGIVLIDWDAPMLAPRERDLLFVVGSRIARRVEPHEEAWFFEGYGEATVDHEAIVFFRYERIFEDIAVDARAVFTDATLSPAARASAVALVEGLFAPGNIVEGVER